MIDVDNKKSIFSNMAHTSGGVVLSATINNQPVGMVLSFGQPFPGRLFYNGAGDYLKAKADGLMGSGAEFINIADIFRKVLLDTTKMDYEHLTGTDGKQHYDEEALIQAELYYWKLLGIEPYNTDAVIGIIKARMARVQKGNLVWDIRRREQLRLRLTMAGQEGNVVMEKEIGILKQISDVQRLSIALLMELYSDPTMPYGPGALLRGEMKITDSKMVNEILKLLYSTGRRFAAAELELGRERMLLNFFNQDDSRNVNSRAFAVGELANAYTYVTELLRLLNPYVSLYEPKDENDSLSVSSDMLLVSEFQDKIQELVSLANQGYNPFGFLNDFVPFVSGNSDNNNLSTFNAMSEIAKSSIDIAKEKESRAEQYEKNFLDFSKEHAQYEERLAETQASYMQRLKSLIGTVKIEVTVHPLV